MNPTTLMLLALVGCTAEGPSETDPPVDDACNDEFCVLSGTYTEDLTLTADRAWLLRGGVFIGDEDQSATLTIEPGTIVYGESSSDGMLVIRRGSRILADGTSDAPIVMTSSKPEGSRARGDWGGLILNGRAPVNVCAQGTEACESFGEGGTGWYGGTDEDDDSGVLRYLRVEFAGTLVSPDNELNGIAFQGVGRGTVVDYVQVHLNADDGIEFFGGTVEAKHILVTGVGDDSLDWTDGWRGKLQFGLLEQFDDASGDNGIEADNNADNNDAEPRSFPTLANLTVLGSPDSDASDYGILLREGTAVHLYNSEVRDFNDACLDIDHQATFDRIGASTDSIWFENVALDCAVLFERDEEDPDGDGVSNPDPVDIESALFPSGLAATDLTSPPDPFFDAVDHIGAIGATDWTAGWTTRVEN